MYAIRRIKVWICIIMYYLRWILILIKKKEEEISIFKNVMNICIVIYHGARVLLTPNIFLLLNDW